MKLLFIKSLVVSGLALAVMPVCLFAEGPCCAPECPMKEVEITVNRRIAVKTPTCETETKRYLTADLKVENRVIWEEIEVCKNVVKEVPTCKMVPVCVKDPCTGCTRTEYQQQTCVEHVVCQVIETIPVKREYKVIAVRNWKVDERCVPKTCTHYECVPEKVITKVPCGAAELAAPATLPAKTPELIAPPKEDVEKK
jgi:hypothetical protein